MNSRKGRDSSGYKKVHHNKIFHEIDSCQCRFSLFKLSFQFYSCINFTFLGHSLVAKYTKMDSRELRDASGHTCCNIFLPHYSIINISARFLRSLKWYVQKRRIYNHFIPPFIMLCLAVFNTERLIISIIWC